MTTTYPGALDALTNPIAGNNTPNPSHIAQHANANDAIEALETKLGTSASVPTTTGHVLRVTGAGATAYGVPTAASVSYSPTGTIAGTDVQVAVAEVATDAAAALATHGALAQHASASGTSFPAQPAYGNSVPFFRTDRSLMYYYDGTRWLTLNEYTLPLTLLTAVHPIAATGTALYGYTDHGANQMYVTRWVARTLVLTTNNATNYWTVQLVSTNAANADTNVGTSFNTSADTVAVYAEHPITVGATVATTQNRFQVKVTKTLTPSDIYVIAGAFYRLVG